MYQLTIFPNLSVLYGIEKLEHPVTILSKSKIAQAEIGKIQTIVKSWLQVVQIREALISPNQRFRKFQEHLYNNSPIEQWRKEPEYCAFLKTISQLLKAEESFASIQKQYKINSITFLKDFQTSLCPPKKRREKVVV